MTPAHLRECQVVFPRELLQPGEELPEGVAEDIGVQVCAPGCPRAEQRRLEALAIARERGWLTDRGFVWDEPAAEGSQ